VGTRASTAEAEQKGASSAAKWTVALKRATWYLLAAWTHSLAVAVAECRFVLGAIDDNEVRNEDGYSIFEPEISFYIGETNVFGTIYGRPVFNNVVIMHAREEWLKTTVAMVRHVDAGIPHTQYDYNLLGTEYGIVALRKGDSLDLCTKSGYGELRTPKPAGRVTIRTWVTAIADISRQLSDLFRRLQPSLFSDSLYQKQELALQEVESWLIVGPP